VFRREREMTERKYYPDEFKREAVRLATIPGNTMTSVARELGVHRTLIRHWINNAQAGRFDVAPGTPINPPVLSELEQLRRELAKVRLERDILKKALGYFAKDRM
jgi:transposase